MKVGEGDALAGRVVAGKYAVQSVIGLGAMGVVYRAKQIKLEKIVALKVLNDALRDDAEFVQRFHTEARAASRLDHPNSTRVLDFGEDEGGMLYIAMELLDGRTLAELIAREFPLDVARVASIMSQTLSAVGAAHQLKILHRDLKPENIVILEGRDDEDRPIDVVKVCDFGIAKLDGSEEVVGESNALSPPTWSKARTATRAGVIVGTPQYMSPEQARAAKLDVRSDLYSLGVVLYEMLTGRAPFDEGTPADVLAKHVAIEPARPSQLHTNVSREPESICMRALEKSPDDRWPSAREMRAALRPLLDQRATEPSVPLIAPAPSEPRIVNHLADAPTISATAVALEPKRRSRLAFALPIGIVVALGALVVIRQTRRNARVANAAVASGPSSALAIAQVPPQSTTTIFAQRIESPEAFTSAPLTMPIARHDSRGAAREVQCAGPTRRVACRSHRDRNDDDRFAATSTANDDDHDDDRCATTTARGARRSRARSGRHRVGARRSRHGDERRVGHSTRRLHELLPKRGRTGGSRSGRRCDAQHRARRRTRRARGLVGRCVQRCASSMRRGTRARRAHSKRRHGRRERANRVEVPPSMTRAFGVPIALAALASCAVLEPDVGNPSPPIDAGPPVVFGRDIRPLMDRSSTDASGHGCKSCHYSTLRLHPGTDESGLDLSTLGALRRGGNDTRQNIVVPYQPNDSALVAKLAARSRSASHAAPGPPYWTEADIETVEQWILQGAKGDDSE